MFKDLHCHLLPGIDDGSRSMHETIQIMKMAASEGVTEMIMTPHYIENTDFNCNNSDKFYLLEDVKEELKKENIDIKLYLGNEAFLTENFVDLIRKGELTTLNNTRYLLLEFPLNQYYQNSKEILYELVTIGCVPILAHPERYMEFQKHPELAEEYVRMGILLQGNYKSLFGKYGKGAEKALKHFLKKGLITFLASDTHHGSSYDLVKAKKKVKKYVRKDEIVEDLFVNNFDKVVKDEDIELAR